jgi:hypothetical protein
MEHCWLTRESDAIANMPVIELILSGTCIVRSRQIFSKLSQVLRHLNGPK